MNKVAYLCCYFLLRSNSYITWSDEFVTEPDQGSIYCLVMVPLHVIQISSQNTWLTCSYYHSLIHAGGRVTVSVKKCQGTLLAGARSSGYQMPCCLLFFVHISSYLLYLLSTLIPFNNTISFEVTDFTLLFFLEFV